MNRTQTGAALVAAAREVDSQVKAVARRRNADKIELAFLLLDMEERRLAETLGYASVAAYAEVEILQAPSTTRQLLALARKLRELPELAQVGRAGELPWTLLRTVSGVATSENVAEWVEKAHVLPRAELERQAREARGEAALERLTFEASREDLEDIRLAVEGVRRERADLSFSQAVAEICRAFVRGTVGAAASTTRLVLHTCGTCEKTTRETHGCAFEVRPERAAREACDAEVLDVRNGPAAVRRVLPPKVANFVDARDRGRCRVPGCINRAFLERHHEGPGGGRAVGHSPAHVLTLCSLCRVRHKLHYADIRIMPSRARSPERKGVLSAA